MQTGIGIPFFYIFFIQAVSWVEVHELLKMKEKSINKSGEGGYDRSNALLMSFVNNYNPEVICYSCGKKGHKSWGQKFEKTIGSVRRIQRRMGFEA